MAEPGAITLESARRTGHVPASAPRMVVGPFELGDNGEGAKSAPIRMKARTAQPVQHWFWGRVVHDMAGMRLQKDCIPIDYVHKSDRLRSYFPHRRPPHEPPGGPAAGPVETARAIPRLSLFPVRPRPPCP